MANVTSACSDGIGVYTSRLLEHLTSSVVRRRSGDEDGALSSIVLRAQSSLPLACTGFRAPFMDVVGSICNRYWRLFCAT